MHYMQSHTSMALPPNMEKHDTLVAASCMSEVNFLDGKIEK